MKSLSLLIVVLCSAAAHAQPVALGVQKSIHAVRCENGKIKLDGALDEAAWLTARFVSGFLQKDPTEGAPPTDSVRVAILYDDEALYVGARMSSTGPKPLRMHLDRRDTQGPAEQLIVVFDTFRNRRTAYGFGVNAAGVRFDRFHPEDTEFNRDFSYDPVWQAQTATDSLGWSVEMRIPFSQLRFNNQDEQVWGVNFNHWIPERREDVYWIYTPRNEVGYASRFGDLVGIRGIKPSRRLELLPYATGRGQVVQAEAGNPFQDDVEATGNAGADLKMGLGPNLTLDATINPDFGQVEADPAVVNLSAYETFFSERRPFFTEGRELFAIDGPSYFYSRRIGQAPRGPAGGDFVHHPTGTTILSAGKVTGRLASGTAIGLLSAVTQREHAKSYDSVAQVTTKTEVEPATFSNVLRVQQEFGEEGSTAGIIFTGVHRDLPEGHALAGILRRDALTGGADWNWRLRDGEYEIAGFAGFSHVRGDTAAIRRTQQSSAHYFQRPDQDHVSVDPRAISLSGWTAALNCQKQSGRHWLGQIGIAAESPGFELNDIGILNSADDIDAEAELTYRETTPGRVFRAYRLTVNATSGWNFGGVRQYAELSLGSGFTWNNYWETELELDFGPRNASDAETRGGPLIQTPVWWGIAGELRSNFANPTSFGIAGQYARDEWGGWEAWSRLSVSARVGNRAQISAEPFYLSNDLPRQCVATIDTAGGGEQTYGKRYVFSWIARNELSLRIRANYFFTPDLSLEIYAEPFAAGGRFHDHGELLRAADNAVRQYGTAGTTITRTDAGDLEVTDGPDRFTLPDLNFGYRSFRSNAVLRWEFRPGSTLYFVWQRNLEGEEDPGRHARPKSLFDSFGLTGEDFVALKISYWIPIT